jgi:hypothetical protein
MGLYQSAGAKVPGGGSCALDGPGKALNGWGIARAREA